MNPVTRCKLLFVALCCASASVWAQSWPTKTLTMLVPYPAGGPSDVVGRIIQPEMAKRLNGTMIIENVAGAAGSIAIQKMLTAPSDGYAMLLGTPMELVLAPLGMSAVKHKPEDMRLVGQVMQTSMALLVRKDLPVKTVDELVALAKSPGTKELSFGSLGQGSLYHLLAERFSQEVGIKMLHVPYKGAAPLIQDLLGGTVDLVFIPWAGSTPDLVKDGKLKVLGIASTTRDPRAPEVPTLNESRALDDFAYDVWIGIEVPKAVPDEVVGKIHRALSETMMLPSVRKAIEDTGGRPATVGSLRDESLFYAKETSRYQAIAKSINLQPQ